MKDDKYEKYYNFLLKIQNIFEQDSAEDIFDYYINNIYDENFQNNMTQYNIKHKEYFNKLIFKNFKKGEILGEGSYGQVFKFSEGKL